MGEHDTARAGAIIRAPFRRAAPVTLPARRGASRHGTLVAINRAAIVLCLVLAGLELVHPAWSDDAVSGAVTPFWVQLHVALLVGYALLAGALYRTATNRLARGALVLFAVLNSAFLVVDGLVVGLRAPVDPASADALWATLAVTLLANATGAVWCAALLALAAGASRTPDRVTSGLLALTWLSFVGAAFGVPQAASRLAALATMAWLAYRGGTAAIGSALLVFAAVLRQHVGPEGALGLLCVAAALAWPRRRD